MGLFKKVKKRTKSFGKSLVKTKALGFFGIVPTIITAAKLGADLIGGPGSDKDKIDLRQLDRIAIEQQAQSARDKEEKRRRRRGNIGTRPLGALVSNSLRTRVLTGQ